MARWHVEEKNKSSERRGARMREAQSRKGGGGIRETAVEGDGRQDSTAPGRLQPVLGRTRRRTLKYATTLCFVLVFVVWVACSTRGFSVSRSCGTTTAGMRVLAEPVFPFSLSSFLFLSRAFMLWFFPFSFAVSVPFWVFSGAIEATMSIWTPPSKIQ